MIYDALGQADKAQSYLRQAAQLYPQRHRSLSGSRDAPDAPNECQLHN
jgi:hypothetical protein